MKQNFRRVLLLVLVLMIAAALPLTAYAATISGLTDTSIGLSNSNGTWSASGTTITGSIKGSSFLGQYFAADTTLTITNNKSSDAILSFDYSVYFSESGESSLAIGGTTVLTSSAEGQTLTGSSGDISLASGASTTVKLVAGKRSGDNTTTLTITNIKLVVDTRVTTAFLPVDNGSYTVNGTTVGTDGYSATQDSTVGYPVVATPASGYKFFAWYEESTDNYLSYDASTTLNPEIDGNIYPVFVNADAAIFGVGSIRFADLGEAASYAASYADENLIVLLGDGTISGNYTIPAGETLLIPFDDVNTVYTTEPGNVGYTGTQLVSAVQNDWVKPTAYRTLTMAYGSSITVNGSISVGGKHAFAAGSKDSGGTPSGNVGFIKMSSGSSITVNNGGGLYVWGYITGSGTVTAKSGGVIYENFQIADFRGGTGTDNLVNGASTYGVFPISQYYVQNVEVKEVLEYGSNVYVYTSVFMSKMAQSAGVKFIGDGAMFELSSGSTLTKTYLPGEDRMLFEVNGNISIKNIDLSLGGVNVNSSEYELPINGNMTIQIHSGTTTVAQDVAMIPGVKIVVDEGATLDIASGYNLYLYDKTEWGNYVHSVGGVQQFRAVAYSPTRTYTRSTNDLVDATLDINGTMIADGYVYTTASGAKITSSGGTGVFIVNGGAGTQTITYQAIQNSDNTMSYQSISINPAWLYNGIVNDAEDFTLTNDAAAGDKYFWSTNLNKWVKYQTFTITWKNDDGTVLATDTVVIGDIPVYSGETPTKAADAQYTYTFDGKWNTEIVPATADAEYTVDYTETLNKYTITWIVDGVSTTTEVEYGTVPEFAGTPTKDSTDQFDYTFSGWDTEPVAVTGDATYTAQFEETARKYTITWVNGDSSETEEVEYGAVLTPPANPTKDADAQYTYTFAGWVDKDENKFVEGTTVTGDATYTATYDSTVNTYTVIWKNADANGTVLETDENVPYGTVPTYDGATPTKADDEKATYTFKSWNPAISSVTGDVTYTAVYEEAVKSYTITWKNENGDVLQSGPVNYGTTPTYTGETPTKEGDAQYSYTFAGWTPEVVEVTGEATYTAVFDRTVNSYTVTWVNENGAVLDTDTVAYGEKPSYAGETPTKAATAQYTYTFAGWDKEIVEVTGNVTYTATYTSTVNKYTITFVNEDGTELQKTEVEYGKTPVYSGDTPTKDATARYTYAFAGWDSEIAKVTGDATYTATYSSTVNEYTITFVNEGGAELQSSEVAYGETPVYSGETPTKAATAQYSYAFAGWTPEIATVTGAATYTATYTETPNTYDIAFDWAGGSCDKETPASAAYGTTVTFTAEPTRTGYTFAGFKGNVEITEEGEGSYSSFTMPAENVTITALWTVNQYTITFDTDGGSEIAEITQDYGSAVTAPANPTKEGYTFAGWDTTIPSTMPAGDLTIAAKWTVNQYTITFDTDGGSEIAEITQDYNSAITAPEDPTKEGYKFVGWFVDNQQVEIPATMPAKDMTLTAKWEICSYTVTYMDGEGELRTKEYEFGAVVDLTGATKAGYTFNYWTDADGKQITPPLNMGAENVTLYANWTAQIFTVTYKLENGDYDKIYNVACGDTVQTIEDPTKEGYKFTGWDKDIPATMPAENLTFTATWEIQQYTITFNTDGGTEIAAITQDYGTAVAAPADPTKTGYTFVDWDAEIPATMPAEDLTITAQWKINQYTITFDTAGGTEIAAITQNYNSAVTAPANPTREGYEFNCWDKQIPTTMPAENVTITAKWTINQYTITFDTDGGSAVEAITQDYGTAVTAPANPTKTGYEFTGWDVEIPGTMPAKDMTITAKWTINQYTITFVTAGGTVVEPITQDYGTEITKPADPTREGYKFDGWDKEIPSTMPAEDVTITAQWEVLSFTITWIVDDVQSTDTYEYGTVIDAPTDPTKEGFEFHYWAIADGENLTEVKFPYTVTAEDVEFTAVWGKNLYTVTLVIGSETYDTMKVEYGAAISLPTPVKEGYTFSGWSECPATMPAENLTITGSWTVIQYTITFNTDGGSAVEAITQDYGTTVTAPADPEKTGYTFVGWSPAVPETMPAGGLNVTAQWKVKQYTITFDTDGGSAVEAITQDYNTAVTVPAAPTKTGYEFDGWDVEIPETMPAENVTITAKWTVNQYTITFNTDGGSEIAAITQDYNTAVTAPANPTKEGYSFAGWDKEIPPTMPAENVTITAKWTINQYTITFDTDGGTTIKSIKQDYNTAVTAPADPTKTGYAFDGWDVAIPETMPAKDMTITAQWKINQYSIKFNANGGDAVDTITEDYGKTVTLPVPTREGYSFVCWNFADGSSAGAIYTIGASDVELTAVWKINSHTVTYYVGESVYSSGSVVYGQALTLPKDPAQDGYTFAGWVEKTDGKKAEAYVSAMPDKDLVFEATWTANAYTITFADCDVNAITQAYGTAIAPVADPTREGYTFTGWSVPIPETMPAKNMTITAQWEVNSYTLTFKDQEGNVLESGEVEYGTAITAPATEKTGYTFKGWDKEIPATMPAEEVTITGTWTINQYTITFNSAGGSAVASITANYGEAITKPADPTRTGYTFGGWDQVIPETMPAGDMIITAKWTVNQYTITFVDCDVKPITQDYDTAISAVADPTREGYIFTGWDKEIPATMPAEDMTITAQWTINAYTVTFTDGFGKTISSEKMEYGAEITYPEAPSVYGYTFNGWTSDAKTVPAADLTIDAQWTTNQYTLTLTDGEETIDTITQDYATTAELPGAEKAHYLFAGWDADDDGAADYQKGDVFTFNADAELTALWTAVKYTVSFETNGGSEVAGGGDYVYGDKLTAPATTKEGYTFQGWTTTNDPNAAVAYAAGAEITVSGNLEFFAKWKVNSHRVEFIADGEVVKSGSLTYGSKITAPTDPTKAGYTFTGWDPAIPETMPDQALTFVAQWQINTYTVSWDIDGDGKVDETTSVKYNEKPVHADGVKAEDPEYTYTFIGWNPVITAVTGDVTYTAQFEKTRRDYTITWIVDGSETITTQVSYGTVPTYPKGTPVKVSDGMYTYEFTGWDKEIAAVTGVETYTAGFSATAVEYQITLDLGNGVIEGGETVITAGYGTEITLKTPSKTGYTFMGWFDEDGKQYETLTMPVNGLKLAASWKVNQYTITFEDCETEPLTLDYGAVIGQIADPTREGYSFTGWSMEFPETMPAENLTVTAGWKINQYTITFNTDGGTEINSITQDYGTDITAPADPTKEGHTFAGWDVEIPAVMPAGDMTITAKWTVNQYTITFMYDEEEVAKVTQDYGTEVELPEPPVKEGYSFAGWVDAKGKTVKITNMPAKNMTVYTSWTINTYRVNFWIDEDTTDTAYDYEEYTYGEAIDWDTMIKLRVDPEKTGYTFTGWNVENVPEIMPAENVDIYATWEINTYTISFNTAGGSEVASITAEFGTEITKPADPTKVGNTFAGWDTEIPATMPGENMTITAQWTINQYTITFLTDGGSEVAPMTLKYATEIAVPAEPTKDGYVFIGWEPELPESMPAENLTVTAQWVPSHYLISWDTNGDGTADVSDSVGYNMVPHAPAASKTATAEYSYEFTGWDKTIEPATQDVTYTAQFKEVANVYTITFDTDGGSKVDSVSYAYGAAVAVPADPTKDHCVFNGWAPALPETMPAKNLTVVAQWTNLEYTITFVDSDGTVISKVTAPWGNAISAPSVPEKTGYTFTGWDVEVPATMPQKDMTITAVRTANTYTITFDTDGGTQIDPITDVYGAAIVAPIDPSKDGYIFLGWDTEIPATMPDKDMTIKAIWRENITGWYSDDHGTTYLIDGQMYFYDMAIDVDGDGTDNYFGAAGYVLNGLNTVDGETCVFDELGVIRTDLNGLYEQDGDIYLIKNGVLEEYTGLLRVVKDSGEVNYYYFSEDFKAVKDTAVTVSEGMRNGYLVQGDYTIGSDGVITHHEDTSRQGVHQDENGVKCYYIDGVKVYYGLFQIGKDYYYATADGSLVIGQDYLVERTNGLMEEGTYTFDEEGKMVLTSEKKNGIYAEDGSLYYYVDDVRTYAGLIEIDGDYYYVRSSGEVVHGCEYWITKTNDLMEEGMYTFDEDGKMILEDEKPSVPSWSGRGKNGIYSEDGGLYFYRMGKRTYAGLIKINGSYYYVRTSGQVVTDQLYWVTKTNGLMPSGMYQFDENGCLVPNVASAVANRVQSSAKNGIVSENGSLYYYAHGKLNYAGLIEIDGSYYYVRTCGEVVNGRTYWITKTNGLLPEGSYTFGEDGKLILPEAKDGFVAENGGIYYYVDGALSRGGLIEVDGAYYYVRTTTGEVVTGRSYWITRTNGLMDQGMYSFDETGKLITG